MNRIKMLFSGDFATVGRCENHPDEKIHEVFSAIKPIIDGVDLHITNLECPLTNTSEPILKTGPVIKAKPETIRFYSEAKVGVACMANNHIRDFDNQGVKDTLNLCKSNDILTVGAGLNKQEASAILYKEVNGVRVAFLNYCETEFSIAGENTAGANPIDYIQLYDDIKESKKKSDYIIVIYHGGNEYYPLPNIRIKKFFHHCIDLGADAVIGHHTHVFSGYEIYKDKPLVYSLGNFLFDETENDFEGWFTGLLAEITLDSGKISLDFYPIRQSKFDLKLERLEGKDKDEVLDEVNRLSDIIDKDRTLIEAYRTYSQKQGFNLVKAISNLTYLQKGLLKLGYPLKQLLKKDRLIQIQNLIQCESHRDIILTYTKKLNL